MQRTVGVLCAALAVIAPVAAHADTPPAYQRGVALYQQGDYAGAALAFRAAYAATPDPALLYDIAQAYRLGHDCPEARQFLQAYLAAAPAGARERIPAAQMLLTIDACASTTTTTTTTTTVASRGGSRTKRVAGLVSAGAGVVAATAAALFGWRAHAISTEIEDTLGHNGGTWTADLQRKEDRAQRDDAAAIGLSLGGAAAMVAGGALWYLGRTREPVVLVSRTTGGAAVTFAGRF